MLKSLRFFHRRPRRPQRMTENEIGNLTYMRLTGMKLEYLMNFGKALMKDGITRAVNGLEED